MKYVVMKDCGFSWEAPVAEFDSVTEARQWMLANFSERQRLILQIDICIKWAL